MAMLARDLMTPNPACCLPDTTLDQVAKMMVQHSCGAILIVDVAERPVGIVTDRDIVCRVVAEGLHPAAHTADHVMTRAIVTVPDDATLDHVVRTMARHRIRRVPVVGADGCCAGIIAQADIAAKAPGETAGLVRDLSRRTRDASR